MIMYVAFGRLLDNDVVIDVVSVTKGGKEGTLGHIFLKLRQKREESIHLSFETSSPFSQFPYIHLTIIHYALLSPFQN
jgi:hypothetical protein